MKTVNGGRQSKIVLPRWIIVASFLALLSKCANTQPLIDVKNSNQNYENKETPLVDLDLNQNQQNSGSELSGQTETFNSGYKQLTRQSEPLGDNYFKRKLQKREAQPFTFGVGKRLKPFTFGVGKRLKPFTFGVGKRLKPFTFGVGKRLKPFTFGVGKRLKPFTFGVGKRLKPFTFGVGKRLKPFTFGVGKRMQPFTFGVGKREPMPFTFGVGKRGLKPFTFGVGKRMEPYYDYNDEKRTRQPFTFGIGKKDNSVFTDQVPEKSPQFSIEKRFSAPNSDDFNSEDLSPFLYNEQEYPQQATLESDKRFQPFTFGVGKRDPMPFTFGVGKRSFLSQMRRTQELPKKWRVEDLGDDFEAYGKRLFTFGIGKRSNENTE